MRSDFFRGVGQLGVFLAVVGYCVYGVLGLFNVARVF